MLYNLEQTEAFAAQQNPVAKLLDVIEIIQKEHYTRTINCFPKFNGCKGVRAEKYAENKNPTPSAVDLAFAVSNNRNAKIVLSEMKFDCASEKQAEKLASDIVDKVKGTKDLFSQDIPFFNKVYVLVDDGQQRLLSRLQRELTGKKNSDYKVCILKNMYDDFFAN